jgi:hypothetical protein
MRSALIIIAIIAAAGLAACGAESDVAADGDSAPGAASGVEQIAATVAKEGGSPIIFATHAEVEQAHKCRGVIGAAFAARTVMNGNLPAEVAGITSDAAMYWTNRAARMRAPEMTEADYDALIASSVRVLATLEAIENALPQIRECLAAQAEG